MVKRTTIGVALGGLWLTVALGAPAAAQEGADSDAAFEAELAIELGRVQERADEPDMAVAPASSPAAVGASSMGLSNLLNPALSANGLLLGGYSSRNARHRAAVVAAEGTTDLATGIRVQEVELRLSAVVDPYLRADLTLAAGPEEIEIEEAVLSTLELPHVTIRGGKLRAAFGRHNSLHTHAYPFVTAPMPWRLLLGEEGLADAGLSAEILLPLPFYTEVTLQTFDGEWDPFAGGREDDPATVQDEFRPDGRRQQDLGYLGHLETLVELGDSTTVEVGGTYLGGRNGFRRSTHVAAADLTLKWRPVDAERYTSFEWLTEWVWVDRQGAPETHEEAGGYSQVRYQFGQRWWVQARASYLGVPGAPDANVYRYEALAAFVPSEFSALRLQYAVEPEPRPGLAPVHELFLQAIFSIGSHPAHAY